MPSSIAALAYIALIFVLFWLDREPRTRVSKAIWVPIAWWTIVCSRSVSLWLRAGGSVEASADQVLEGSPVDRLAYSLMIAGAFAILATRINKVQAVLRKNTVILLFLGYCALSILWSDFPGTALKRWIRLWGDLAMVLVVLTDPQPIEAIKKLLARTGCALIVLSVLFIKYFPELGRGYGFWLGEVSYFGVTTNKNTLGAICLFFGLASLWRVILALKSRDRSRTRHLVSHLVVIAFIVWLFKIADSMTSAASFVMGSVILVAANMRMVVRRPWMLYTGTLVMLTAVVGVLFFGTGGGALNSMGRNSTLTGRTEVWSMVLALVPNPILGAGFESFWLGSRLEKMWTAYWWHPNQAHNGYIEIFINLGAVGILLLLVVLANRYRLLASGWRKGDPLGTLWLAYFSVVLVFNCTEAAFFRMQAPAWLFFLLAITQRPDQLSPNTSGRRRREPAVAIEAEPLEIQTLHYSN